MVAHVAGSVAAVVVSDAQSRRRRAATADSGRRVRRGQAGYDAASALRQDQPGLARGGVGGLQELGAHVEPLAVLRVAALVLEVELAETGDGDDLIGGGRRRLLLK